MEIFFLNVKMAIEHHMWNYQKNQAILNIKKKISSVDLECPSFFTFLKR